jgi:hypothetical protein
MHDMKGAGYPKETSMKTKGFAALAALAVGLTFAPAAWAAGNQTQTPASHQRVNKPHPAQSQQAPVPQNSCDYDRAAGNCMIDLGYGRCMPCNADPDN